MPWKVELTDRWKDGLMSEWMEQGRTAKQTDVYTSLWLLFEYLNGPSLSVLYPVNSLYVSGVNTPMVSKGLWQFHSFQVGWDIKSLLNGVLVASLDHHKLKLKTFLWANKFFNNVNRLQKIMTHIPFKASIKWTQTELPCWHKM